MEFFREHKKLIVGIITVSFVLWMVGMGAIGYLAVMSN